MSYKTDLQANNSGLQEILDAVNSLPKHEEVILQEKTVTPSTVEQEVIPDGGYTALSEVTVKAIPSEYVVPSGELEITENGSFDVKDYAVASVNVQSGDTLKAYLDARGTAYQLFYDYKGITVDDLISYNTTENVTNMGSMFYGCSNLTSIPLFNTSNATNMAYMFRSCSKLTSVPLFDTSSCKNMTFLLYGCTNLTSVPLFDTSKVTDMEYIVASCTALTTVPLFDTSSCTTTRYMFSECTNLTSVPLFDTSKVTTMDYMFNKCSKLTSVPLFDTSKVTSMNSVFYNCINLTSVPSFDVSNSTNLYQTFFHCIKLPSVSLLDISNVTSVGSMFRDCNELKSVTLGKISSKVTSSGSWFQACSSLEVIYFKDATGVPTLSNSTYTFQNVPATCKVVVPDALYDTWTTATNWSAINVTWTKESDYLGTGGGEELVPTEGLSYSLSSNGTFATCNGIGTATATDIVIADEYEGVPVTKIGYQAFRRCHSITSVVVPLTVTYVDYEAFRDCSILKSITILGTLTEISHYAFINSSNTLKRLDLSYHRSVPVHGTDVFSSNRDLQIKVPASLIDSWKSATNWSDHAEKIVTEFTN